jgi:hypothetical protein
VKIKAMESWQFPTARESFGMGRTSSLFQLSSVHCNNYDIFIAFNTIAGYDKKKHGGKRMYKCFLNILLTFSTPGSIESALK